MDKPPGAHLAEDEIIYLLQRHCKANASARVPLCGEKISGRTCRPKVSLERAVCIALELLMEMDSKAFRGQRTFSSEICSGVCGQISYFNYAKQSKGLP